MHTTAFPGTNMSLEHKIESVAKYFVQKNTKKNFSKIITFELGFHA